MSRKKRGSATTNEEPVALLAAIDDFSQMAGDFDRMPVAEQPVSCPREYQHSLMKVLQATIEAEPTVPRAGLIIACCSLGGAWVKWFMGDEERPWPGKDFYSALQRVEELRRSPTRSMPESVAVLNAQKVPARQIAAIWGLRQANNEPDIEAVFREIETPGSVITPDYVLPEHANRIATVERAQDELQRQIEKLEFEGQETAKPSRAKQVAPEPIEKLLGDGVSPRQVAKMKDMPIDEVMAIADEMLADGRLKVAEGEPANATT